jgi:hypothetical protein
MSENDRTDRQGWKGALDEFRPSMFTVQIIVSASIMIFSMVQLAKGEPIEVYLPVMTGISGYWLPAPKNKSTETKAYEKVSNEFRTHLNASNQNQNQIQAQTTQGGFGSPIIPSTPMSETAREISPAPALDAGHIRVQIADSAQSPQAAANVASSVSETV